MLKHLRSALASRAGLAVITAFSGALGAWLVATYPEVHSALCAAKGIW